MTEEAVMIHSCLTDVPLESVDDDRLHSGDYATALFNFIMNADTPVTLGIQGGWGSGKTSLFFLLEDKLKKTDHQALTIRINAWEHSLFQEGEGRGVVVLSILSSLVKAISKIGEESWIDAEDRKAFQAEKNELSLGKKLCSAMGQVLPLVGNLAVQSVIPGAAIFTKFFSRQEPKKEEGTNREGEAAADFPILAEQIHDLKKQLTDFISHIKVNGKQTRIVVFIDDLDRVPPPTAVEILDVIKNIFDIKNCIFVLAIDYEVIVKGLEDKFGERSDKNEREFRQYFDKIIQIPFTMPIGAFSKQIDAMLKTALARLNCRFNPEKESQIINTMATSVKLATGGLPRSIKRILNTFSLLQYIAQQNHGAGVLSDEEAKKIVGRFIIVGLHINFPEICKRVMERPDFTSWDLDELNIPWDLKVEENKTKIKAYEGSRFGEYFDESWEQVVFCLCQKLDWLKNNAVNISRLLNTLRDVLINGPNLKNSKRNDEEKKEENKDLADDPDALSTLINLIDSIKVISMDNDLQSMKIDNAAIVGKQLAKFSLACWNEIQSKTRFTPAAAPESIKVTEDEGGYFWILPLQGEIDQFFIQWSDEDEALYYDWGATRFGMKIADAEEIVNDYLTDDYDSCFYGSGKNGKFEIFSWTENVDFEKVASGALIPESVEKSLKTCALVVKAAKKIKKEME